MLALDLESIIQRFYGSTSKEPEKSTTLGALTIFVAYSGGVDSTVLLHLVFTSYRETASRIIALHVNHGIDCQSDAWEQHCKHFCKLLNIQFRSVKLKLASTNDKFNESDLRAARYEWLLSQLCSHSILLTAHHRDDQAETFLLNLMRGSGVRGLAGIPIVRELKINCCHPKPLLIRPLLNCTRAEISSYAYNHCLNYVVDPSNKDLEIRRNYIRTLVLPALAEKWNSADKMISQSASLMADANELMEQLGAMDAENCRGSLQQYFSDAASLSVEAMRQFTPARQANLLRYWLRIHHFPPPAKKVLHHMMNSFLHNSSLCYTSVQWANCVVHRYQGELFLAGSPADLSDFNPISWDLNRAVLISEIGLKLSVNEAESKDSICVEKMQGKITVNFRKGGERIHLPNRKHSSSLKKVFQASRIAPWERSMFPVLYCDDEIVAVIPWLISGKFISPKGQRGLEVLVEKVG